MPRDLIKESNNLYRKDGLIKKSIQDKTVAAFIALAQQQGISTIGLTTPELKKGDEQAIVDFSNNEDDNEPTLYDKDYDLSYLYETPQLQELSDISGNMEKINELKNNNFIALENYFNIESKIKSSIEKINLIKENPANIKGSSTTGILNASALKEIAWHMGVIKSCEDINNKAYI